MKGNLRSKLKKGMGMLFVLAFSLGVGLYICGETAYAATEYIDKEDNDSPESAQFIFRNTQTAAQAASTSISSSYRYVTGKLDKDDEDWYRISLDADDIDYLDMNVGTGTIFVELYRSTNLNDPIREYRFTSYGDLNVQEVRIVEDGTYYLRIYHTTTGISSTYNFTIGNPQYTKESYTHSFGRQVLEAKATWEDVVNPLDFEDIPEGAIAYEISIGGCSSSVSSKRYFCIEDSVHWTATKTTYSYSLPVTNDYRVDQQWSVRIVSTNSSRKTITPTVTIRYVAPVLP